MDSAGNLGSYNNGILAVMGVGIAYAAAVIVAIVAVVVGVNQNNLYPTFFYFHLPSTSSFVQSLYMSTLLQHTLKNGPRSRPGP